jgi:hypothetical protein
LVGWIEDLPLGKRAVWFPTGKGKNSSHGLSRFLIQASAAVFCSTMGQRLQETHYKSFSKG